MKEMVSQHVHKAGDGVRPLYAAAFAMATSLGVLWTVMPFIVRNIGGTEEHVGYTWAANMFGYMVSLLVAAALLGHLNARRATRLATAAMFTATLVTLAVVWYALSANRLGEPVLIWTMIAAGTLAGAAMSLYWPFLMAWVSADYEGARLNRRLGTYNGMWSGAAILGPLIGGVLVDISTLGPIITSAAFLAICFILLCLAHDESAGSTTSSSPDGQTEVCIDHVTLARLKWMARIAMFCAWACLGVCRSQFALLFTDLGFSETQFGILITIFAICNFLALTGAGRFDFWHFKPSLLFGIPGILTLSLGLIIFGRTPWAFVPAFVIMGVGFGFSYSSHLYYASCGSRKRSAPMAIHEVTLSLGVIVGSGAGGYLCGHVGPYSPYWFAIGVLALGAMAQALILFVFKTPSHNART